MTDKLTTTKAKALAKIEGPSTDLIRLAIEGNVDVDKLERLVAMHERAMERQARQDFFDALSGFQSEIPTIPKAHPVYSKGGQLLYKFANSDDIAKAIREIERKHNLSHRFEIGALESGGITVSCIVTHAHGHSETTTIPIPETKGMNTNAAQNRGIEVQYGMRYALCGAYGITTATEDTDGKGEDGDGKADEPLASLIERKSIMKAAKDRTIPLEELQALVKRVSGVDHSDDIPAKDVPAILDAIKKWTPSEGNDGELPL